MAPIKPPAPPDAGQGTRLRELRGQSRRPACAGRCVLPTPRTWGRPGRWGPRRPRRTGRGLKSQASAADTWCCRRGHCPPGPRRPVVSGLSGDTGDGVQPGMLPGPRRCQQPGPAGHSPGGKRVGPGDQATAAPVAPVALFPGTDGGGGTLTTAIKAPDGGGLAWGRPMRGPLGLQGPEPHSPHTLAQAEQQEWRGCCRLSQGSDVGLCRAPPEGQWHSRRTVGGWPAPRAGGRPGRAGGQCGEAPALTPVREVK